ncbi:MAG: arsenite methyltransferase [Candidatus Heimdallarchaeota archaeon]|nr:arsenite methyltransferase [Candidatus Heimdallarchaeota archaeon]MCK4955402.1 arsenite methyltransferase [Candidatus Heimdallarchaeota archaeon]
MESEKVKKVVRDRYGKVAKRGSSCCGPDTSAKDISKVIGYSSEELDSIPDASNMGLGCGNPTAIASLKKGEVVLDLGAGGGLDCFLAAQKVGSSGKVIGVDMTADMIDLARDNAKKNNFDNVEFRLGEIENLPVADSTVDIVISNCVINLSPEKQRVFNEAFRILKPGGRIAISDLVLLRSLPESIVKNEAYLAGCIAGAELRHKYIEYIKNAGFTEIEVTDKSGYPIEILTVEETLEGTLFEDLKNSEEEMKIINKSIQSITVTAKKIV